MSATKLLEELRVAANGRFRVVEEPGWKKRGNTWRGPLLIPRLKPEGVMQHHTAPPNPFPIASLYADGRVKCNMATHEDGTLYLVAYKACNYSSGPGSKVVLKQNVRKENPPTANARARNLFDDYGGNRHFWNYENSHPGDGSNLPLVQFMTIVVSNVVVNRHFGLNYGRIISHAEHTRRKVDPRWNGSNRTAIEQIRDSVEKGEDMSVSRSDKADDGLSRLAPNFDEMVAAGVFTAGTQPGGITFNDELGTFLLRFEDYIVDKYSLGHDGPSDGLQRGDSVVLT